MTINGNIISMSIGLVCLIGFIWLLLYLYPDKDGLNIKAIRLERVKNDTNNIITLPSNSIILDYPTDTIYIHDTIYIRKK